MKPVCNPQNYLQNFTINFIEIKLTGKHLLWKLHLLPLADWALYHTLLNWFGLYSYKRIHFSNIPADRTVQLYSTHSHTHTEDFVLVKTG